ncbi:MAG: hypothetical protein QOJ83_2466 [Frankiales bacterium]|nr:hypothetical protein [Frankiales bacterium]
MKPRRRVVALSVTTALVASAAAAAPLSLLGTSSAAAATFGGNHLVVYRVGSGAAPLSNAATAVYLDEYSPAGVLVRSIPVRTAKSGANAPLTATGLSTSEGEIVRSANGRFLTITGYDAVPGSTGPGGLSLTASLPTTVPRTLGIVDGNGTVDTSTTLTDGPAIVRSAATIDGAHFWVAGGNGGLRATTLGAHTSTAVAGDATSNLNEVTVQGGALFTSASSGSRLSLVSGSAAPGKGGTLTGIPGLPGTFLPYGYSFLDLNPNNYAGTGLDTLYVLDDADRGGAVDKYAYTGAGWTLAGSVALDGAFALTATRSGTTVSLAVTTPTGLYSLSDGNGAASTFPATTPVLLASAPANTAFRGVALAPTAPTSPTVFLHTPALGQRVAGTVGTVSLSADVTSAKGVKSVLVGLDKTKAVAAKLVKGSATYTSPLDLNGLKAGIHTVHLTATDKAGARTTVTSTFTYGKLVVPAKTAGPGNRSLVSTKGVVRKGFAAVGYKGAPGGKGLISTATGKITLTVYGRGFQLHLAQRKDAGKVKVTIGAKSYVIDLYSKKSKDYVKVFKGLTLGKHKVTITALHSKRKASAGYTVFVGWLKVTL